MHYKLVVIVGPTASGKSDLAMRVAKEFNGEIIAADSRTVYRGMDIGTSKPSALDQKQVKHWGIDLVDPGERFSAAQFKNYAQNAIKDIKNRGKLPILIGGTGLYIDGVIYNFEFHGDLSAQERSELEKLTTDQLQAKIKHMGFKMPQNDKNKRHLVRTIERQGQIGSKQELPVGVVLVGLNPPDEVLKASISARAEWMFKQGIIEETEVLVDKYGREALTKTAGIIYELALRVIDKEISRQEAVELCKTADWQYARRQRTWFKRNPDIQWFSSANQAHEHISSILNN